MLGKDRRFASEVLRLLVKCGSMGRVSLIYARDK